MLHTCSELLLAKVNQHIKARVGIAEEKVILANLEQGAPQTGQIVMSLVDIGPEALGQGDSSYIPQGGSFVAKKAPITLNVHLLFSSHFPTTHMLEGLQYLSQVIAFFQSNNYFDKDNTPPLQAIGLDHLSVEIAHWEQQEKTQLWTRIGVPYKPSVLYKVSTIYIEDTGAMGTPVPEIKDIVIQ